MEKLFGCLKGRRNSLGFKIEGVHVFCIERIPFFLTLSLGNLVLVCRYSLKIKKSK